MQASKLWFKKLTKFLCHKGHEHSPMDLCVMRKFAGSSVWILLIYVDDILILADEVETRQLIGIFQREFHWITHSTGCEQSYLRMIVRMERGAATLDMTYYVKKYWKHTTICSQATPGGKNTFVVNNDVKLLREEQRRLFHTQVARLLYLSKRGGQM
jgi:hypothetical protein